jgi:hypothetical protein
MNADACSRSSIVAADEAAAAAFDKLRREMQPVIFARIRAAEAACKQMLEEAQQVRGSFLTFDV